MKVLAVHLAQRPALSEPRQMDRDSRSERGGSTVKQRLRQCNIDNTWYWRPWSAGERQVREQHSVRNVGGKGITAANWTRASDLVITSRTLGYLRYAYGLYQKPSFHSILRSVLKY